jgi:histidyl-tRNA synthetase
LQGGRAILGGGHYGNLVSAVGGEPLPGIGFAMGDVMSTIVLQKYGCVPGELGTVQADQVLVTVFDDSFLLKSYQLAAELRTAGFKAWCIQNRPSCRNS